MSESVKARYYQLLRVELLYDILYRYLNNILYTICYAFKYFTIYIVISQAYSPLFSINNEYIQILIFVIFKYIYKGQNKFLISFNNCSVSI